MTMTMIRMKYESLAFGPKIHCRLSSLIVIVSRALRHAQLPMVLVFVLEPYSVFISSSTAIRHDIGRRRVRWPLALIHCHCQMFVLRRIRLAQHYTQQAIGKGI